MSPLRLLSYSNFQYTGQFLNTLTERAQLLGKGGKKSKNSATTEEKTRTNLPLYPAYQQLPSSGIGWPTNIYVTLAHP